MTFGFGQVGLVTAWNEAALESDQPELFIGEFVWTDEPNGVFGFAFSETMSVVGTVNSGAANQIDELAVIGQPATDGETLVFAAIDLIIQVTEPQLIEQERTSLLADLSVLGTESKPTGAPTVIDGTEYRVAADPDTGVIGIGARATIGR